MDKVSIRKQVGTEDIETQVKDRCPFQDISRCNLRVPMTCRYGQVVEAVIMGAVKTIEEVPEQCPLREGVKMKFALVEPEGQK